MVVQSNLGDSVTTEEIRRANSSLVAFVIKAEKLYGLKSCTFNLHCLTHLAECVKNCGLLWATSAFPFEAHNHTLLKMFNGTQFVPQQITNTFLLKRAVLTLGRQCINDCTSSSVTELLEQFTNYRRYTSARVCESFSTVGLEKCIQICAREVIAIQHLLDVNLQNRRALFYERFIVNHQLFSCSTYVRAKRHSNVSIMYESSGNMSYGNVLGFLKIKPECQCREQLVDQYCCCVEHFIVLVEPMEVKQGYLYNNRKLSIGSTFLIEVLPTDRITAIKPHHIVKKCIRIDLGDKTFFLPLPYRIYGD